MSHYGTLEEYITKDYHTIEEKREIVYSFDYTRAIIELVEVLPNKIKIPLRTPILFDYDSKGITYIRLYKTNEIIYER
jgi:hypothetical protein